MGEKKDRKILARNKEEFRVKVCTIKIYEMQFITLHLAQTCC